MTKVKVIAFIAQSILLGLAYELSCLPVWQYFIVLGLIALACHIGDEYVRH